MGRYCGSCKEAYHHEDGFIRCRWLHVPKEKCPNESDLSYEKRLLKMNLCPNCKILFTWEDFYLGHCQNCENIIKFNLIKN